jgi:hypothetical protein
MLKTARSTVNVDQITGVLPVANGGTGVATSTGTGNTVLSAAPTLSGNVTFSTGNLVIGTSGKGIDFSATPGTGTSELLADYEEGTWTPTLTPATGSITLETWPGGMTYTKIGRVVHICGDLIVQSVSSPTGTVTLGGLPFANKTGFNAIAAGSAYIYDAESTLGNFPVIMQTNNGASTVTINKMSSGTATNIGDYFKAGTQLIISITYPT